MSLAGKSDTVGPFLIFFIFYILYLLKIDDVAVGAAGKKIRQPRNTLADRRISKFVRVVTLSLRCPRDETTDLTF